MSKILKITIQGIGDETLTEHDFVAKGGEGSIYAKGSTGFKIYEDPDKMIPYGKIQDLSTLSHNGIIKPERIITMGSGKPIGHTMRFIKNAYPLGQLFTKAFRNRNHISPEMMVKLVAKLQEIVSHIHLKKILIVDLNEYNFLSSDDFKDIYAIDTNCYQTPNYPATAIMEHIRDRHCARGQNNNYKWNEGTDWFSWAIVTCNMFVGIHAYKGGHPQFDSVPSDERMEKRMQANISIFNPQARIPAACYPLIAIPPALRQWYVETLEKGSRQAPPIDYTGAIKIAATIREIVGSNLFEIKPFRTYDGDIISVYSYAGMTVVVTDNSIYYNDRNYLSSVGVDRSPLFKAKIGFTPKMSRPFAAYIKDGKVILWDIVDGKPINIICSGEDIMAYDGRIYIKNGTSVFELNFIESSFIHASTTIIGNVLDVPGATKVFDGVLFQSLLGKLYVSIFPEKGKCFQVKIDELDNHRIVDAKYENNMLVVVGVNRSGKYNRFVFRFDSNFTKHDCKIFKDIQHTGLNFTVADHGTCVCINEDEKVEVWSNKYGAQPIQILDDPSIQGDMTLYHLGSKILFAKGNQLSTITMKRKP